MERHPVARGEVRKGLGETEACCPPRTGSCLGQSQVAPSLRPQEGGRGTESSGQQDPKGLRSDPSIERGPRAAHPHPSLVPPDTAIRPRGSCLIHPGSWCGFSLGCCAKEAVAHCPGLKPVFTGQDGLTLSTAPKQAELFFLLRVPVECQHLARGSYPAHEHSLIHTDPA